MDVKYTPLDDLTGSQRSVVSASNLTSVACKNGTFNVNQSSRDSSRTYTDMSEGAQSVERLRTMQAHEALIAEKYGQIIYT